MATANLFQTSTLVSRIMTEFFVQKSPIYKSANREYVKEYTQQAYMTGGSINIKIPGYPSTQRGLSVTATAIQDLIVPFNITEDDIISVTRNLTSYDELFKISGKGAAITKKEKQSIVDNYGYPAFLAIEADIEADLARKLIRTAYLTPVDSLDVFNGTAINSYSAISQVDEMANTMKFSPDRFMMMNQVDARLVSDSLQNMFNTAINWQITKQAFIGNQDKGNLAGFNVFRTTELQNHIAGTLAGSTLTVTNVSADGTQITFSGAASNTSVQLVAGDRIFINSVNVLANINFTLTRFRLVVTVAADAVGDGAGNITVTLSYPLMATGEHANVSALPANGATCQVCPSRKVNYAYVKSGVSAVPLMLPEIYGATNNSSNFEEFPIRTVLQGAALEFENNFRIATLVASQVFAPYVIELSSPL